MNKQNKRVQAAKKAARTMANRKQFVEQYSEHTLFALVDILKNHPAVTVKYARSLAAVKANLTRGTYSKFVRTNKAGVIISDKIGLARLH